MDKRQVRAFEAFAASQALNCCASRVLDEAAGRAPAVPDARRGCGGQTRRSTATTLPTMAALSPRMGA
jgi:hypothetical protein